MGFHAEARRRGGRGGLGQGGRGRDSHGGTAVGSIREGEVATKSTETRQDASIGRGFTPMDTESDEAAGQH